MSPKMTMYDKFYGLVTPPFELIPDARFFFDSTVHRSAMAYLNYGLHQAGGFIIITGEVGAGKTILIDNLLSTIDQSSFITAKIVTTQVAGNDLLQLVAGGFGIAQEGLAKGSLLQRIDDFVLAQQRNGKRVLLIVDEAQNLSFEALEELRMLSNIVVDRSMALRSFLLGQPQFRVILGSPRLEQLRQRITAAYHLGPLNAVETRDYVEHRLRRADWKGDPHFAEDCFPLIYRHTEGVPRRINTLCSRLLLFAFLEELHTLTASAVEKTAKDLRDEMAVVTVQPARSAKPEEKVEKRRTIFDSPIEDIARRFRLGWNTARRLWKILHLRRWLIPAFAVLGLGWYLLSGTLVTRTVPPVESLPAPRASVPARLALTNDVGMIIYSGAVHDEPTRTTIIDSLRGVFGADKIKGVIAVNPNAGPVPWLVDLQKTLEYLKTPGARALFDGSLRSVLGTGLVFVALNDKEGHLISDDTWLAELTAVPLSPSPAPALNQPEQPKEEMRTQAQRRDDPVPGPRRHRAPASAQNPPHPSSPAQSRKVLLDQVGLNNLLDAIHRQDREAP
jgi:putative secretion ATPase (PEP-CTERM system associated)